MNNFKKVIVQLLLTILIFAIFYYIIDASVSVKIILSYIIALGFSKAIDKEYWGSTNTEIQILKERIDELESEIESLKK